MREVVKMATVHGQPRELVVMGDTLVPACIADGMEDKLDFIRALGHQPGDVLLCSYPKCGTHWVGSLIRELTSSATSAYRPSVDIMELTSRDTILGLTSPRLLTTHLRPARLPRQLLDHRCPVVLVLRNPKDVFVSAYNQLRDVTVFRNEQTWAEFLASVCEGHVPYGSYFDYLLDWERLITETDINVEVFYYEDLKENIVENLRRLSRHIVVEKTDAELQEVARRCSLSSLREKTRQSRDQVPASLLGSDGQSVLYRKGHVGDWKNQFTVAQDEAFSRLIRDSLGEGTFMFRYE